jgi:hypothetical protein
MVPGRAGADTQVIAHTPLSSGRLGVLHGAWRRLVRSWAARPLGPDRKSTASRAMAYRSAAQACGDSVGALGALAVAGVAGGGQRELDDLVDDVHVGVADDDRDGQRVAGGGLRILARQVAGFAESGVDPGLL